MSKNLNRYFLQTVPKKRKGRDGDWRHQCQQIDFNKMNRSASAGRFCCRKKAAPFGAAFDISWR